MYNNIYSNINNLEIVMKYSDLLNQVKYIIDDDGDWVAIYPGHKDYHYALSKEDLDEQGIGLFYLGD